MLTQELQREFALTGAALGNLSAFYFYGYVAMQIPTGLIADQWGPRKLLTVGAALWWVLARPSPGSAHPGGDAELLDDLA